MTMRNHLPSDVEDKIEGLDLGLRRSYPIDEIQIRTESRTIFEVIRRIRRGQYVMNPDFQRDIVWDDKKQSRLIESVLMRLPLPVFYLAENHRGHLVVVDGLQRLSSFRRFLRDDLALRLDEREGLNGKRFSDLPTHLQNRIEDCNLICYLIDAKVPDRVRLDIFDRVNSGEPLTRQQMRNSLFNGSATRFLRDEAEKPLFSLCTGGSLNRKTMRDREFVNRFCAFRVFPLGDYKGDMDSFLCDVLRRMNEMDSEELSGLSQDLRRALTNNSELFGRHAFRKHEPGQSRRNVLNASLWDVMSTGLSRYSLPVVLEYSEPLRREVYRLLEDDQFNDAITYSTNSSGRVRRRFDRTRAMFREILGDPEY